jgi:hypothetical protein
MECAWEVEEGASGPCAGDVRAAQAPMWARKTQARVGDFRAARALLGQAKQEHENGLQPRASGRGHPSGHPSASSAVSYIHNIYLAA